MGEEDVSRVLGGGAIWEDHLVTRDIGLGCVGSLMLDGGRGRKSRAAYKDRAHVAAEDDVCDEAGVLSG